MTACLLASWFETRGRCRAPHHEGLRPHPEEAATRPSRRMKPRSDEWADGIHPRRVSPSGFAYIDFTFQTAKMVFRSYCEPTGPLRANGPAEGGTRWLLATTASNC